MKLKGKKDKIRKAASAFDPKSTDALTEEYMREKELSVAHAKRAEKASQELKLRAEACGEKFLGNKTLIIGGQYAAGFILTEPAPKFNVKRAKEVLDPKLFMQVTVRVVDEERLKLAFEKGLIKKKLFLSLFDPSDRQPSKVIYVTTTSALKRKIKEGQESDNETKT